MSLTVIEHYKDSSTEDFPLFIIRSNKNKDFQQEMTEIINVFSKGSVSTNLQVLNYLDEESSTSKKITEMLAQINYALRANELRTIFIGWNDNILKTGNFNKLLKVFEQPPRRNWIFLCVSENDKLPQTILSRGIEIFKNSDGVSSRTEESNSLEDIINKQTDDELKDLALDLLSFVNGGQGIIEISQKLRAAPESAENVLRLILNHLANGTGTHSKYMILGKIISKYGKSKEINLNKFDNILIPLKFLLVNDRK